MSLKRAVAVLSRDEDEDVRPAKRVVKGKRPMRAAVDVDDAAGPAAAGEGKGSRSEVGRVCLRCSKRLHLAGEATARGKVVPVGFRCDLSPFRKCSYCAGTAHDCAPVSYPCVRGAFY